MGPRADRPGGRRLPRRITDRVEDAASWLMGVAAGIVVLAGVLIALDVRGHVADDLLRRDARELTQVTAVLVEDARTTVGAAGELPLSGPTPAQWTAPDGTRREGLVPVAGGERAGAPVRIWVDAAGRRGFPSSSTASWLAGVGAGLGVVVLGLAALGCAWRVLRAVVMARNIRRWDREWRRVGPRWSMEN